MQRERVGDFGAERVNRERAEQLASEGVRHASVALVDSEHRRVLAGSTTHGLHELQLAQRAREVEVAIVPVEHDVLVAERERKLVGLRGAWLEEEPVAGSEATKLSRRRVIDDNALDEPPGVAARYVGQAELDGRDGEKSALREPVCRSSLRSTLKLR